jgi:hypothetical protein
MSEKSSKRRNDLGSCVLDKQHMVGIGTVYILILTFFEFGFLNKLF